MGKLGFSETDLIGKSEKDAKEATNGAGLDFRVIKRGGKDEKLAGDVKPERVNVGVDTQGTVDEVFPRA